MLAPDQDMIQRLSSLLRIKSKFEGFAVIYALSLGSAERGLHYMQQYPGFFGKLLAVVCTGSVFLAGGKIINAIDHGV
jgi:hypothetical protein